MLAFSASSKTENTKVWRVEKTGNATVAIYRRKKFHKASGKTYQVFEVSPRETDLILHS
jgi:hypothetical protein